jgi:putative MATE family efflux protein
VPTSNDGNNESTTPSIPPGGAHIIPRKLVFDDLDKRLLKISLPVIANFAISPLIGAVDFFWVNRMGNPLAVAGQAAANQVFNSIFWIASFLPSITAILISKENARGNKEGVRDAVCQAIFVGIIFAVFSTTLMVAFPEKVLSSVLDTSAPALAYAKPYLMIRALASLPALISLVGFSAFRGILDTVTPVKISSFANLFNAVLDPIFIFTLAMGVPGAALATLASEVVSAVSYLTLMRKQKMVEIRRLLKIPSWKQLSPLLKGGAALQLRNISLNLTFLAVTRATQAIDSRGIAANAHALSIQTFQIGGIVLLALSSVAQTIVPNDLEVGGKRNAKITSNRMMRWGILLGAALGGLQMALLPYLMKTTPLEEVRAAARVPATLSCLYQVINGMVFIGEGIMIGTGSFMQLSIGTVVATAGVLWALRVFPPTMGLTGVWIGFGVFNTLRLLSVLIHQLVNGPLAPRNMREAGTE